MNKYVARLLKEWNIYGKIIIAVDFDDTISPWQLVDAKECQRVIKAVKEAREVGAYVVIFTGCDKDRYEEIEAYCKKVGLVIDSINQNPISLPYGNQNKIYANIFIDDRAGLDQALDTLQEAMYRQRAYNYSQVHRDEIG